MLPKPTVRSPQKPLGRFVPVALSFGLFAAGLGASLGESSAFAQGPGAAPSAANSASKPEPTRADLDKARKLVVSGDKKLKAKEYDAALADYRAAEAIKGSPKISRLIGLCTDALGQFQDAVAAYEHYLSAGTPKTPQDNTEVERIRGRVKELRGMPGRVRLELPPDAKVTLDGKPLTAVFPTEVELAPGSHKIAIVAAGFEPFEGTLDVAFASKSNFKPALRVPPPPPPPPPPSQSAVPSASAPPAPVPPPAKPTSMLPAYITGGLALAALGVGSTFGILALSTKSDYKNNPTTSLADKGETRALIADMSFFVAVTLGITSAVLFFTKDETVQSSKSKSGITTAIAPIVTPHGAGAGAYIKF